jgi:hypothetical protein
LPYLRTQIVKRSDQAKGFVVLPKRWIVERTLAWLNRCRRLKDWENLNCTALVFLRLASIRLMLRITDVSGQTVNDPGALTLPSSRSRRIPCCEILRGEMTTFKSNGRGSSRAIL